MRVTKSDLFFYLMAGFLVVSCTPSELDPKEYASWVKDYSNGIHKKKKVGDITFDAQYKPAELIAIAETKGVATNKELFQKRLQEVQGMDYVELRIVSDKGDFIKEQTGSTEQGAQKLYYFSFHFQNDIYLQQGDNRIPCTLYHFERAYDLSKERRFLLGFAKPENGKGEKTLIIDSQALGTGTVKIKFEAKDLENIPQLRI